MRSILRGLTADEHQRRGGLEVEKLIRLADEAMYRAKKAGRTRVAG